MAPTRRNRTGLIAKVNFPLYTVQMLTGRHILVGGGGGTAKTGVANGFEIYEVFHDGEKFVAREIIRHETGTSVVMNCATFSNNKHTYVVAGQESQCQLYSVHSELVIDENIETLTDSVKSNGIRHRKHSESEASNERRHSKVKNDRTKNNNNKSITFVIKPGDSVNTDFHSEEPVQRVVRISHDGKIMATGGVDCQVRLWKFPAMQQMKTLSGHKKEIDDIDFCPISNTVVTIAKDGLAILWNIKTGKQQDQLKWDQPNGSTYLYKRCRFGPIEGKKEKSALFMLANPTGLAKKQKSYLQKWAPEDAALVKAVAIDESLSALAVRDDGRFVAMGTMFSGSVSIYIAFSMQRVLHIPGAHCMFVTGLEFLPVASDKHAVTSISEAAVVSISVDNQVCIHSLPYRHSIPLWIAILIIVFVLICTFILCSFMGI